MSCRPKRALIVASRDYSTPMDAHRCLLDLRAKVKRRYGPLAWMEA